MRSWPENEWLAYFGEVALFGGDDNGRLEYLPSPTEIEERLQDLHWLKRCGFSPAFITNVLELDNPSIDRVRSMVRRHGADETARRCQPFLERTEYDNGCQS